MRILITGADGFVGRHLCAALAKSGKALTLAVRKNTDQINLKGDIRVVSVGPIESNTDWSNALLDVSCVINLAGRAHVLDENVSDPMQEFLNNNCHGAVALFQAAHNAGCTKFLHLSSVHVLGYKTSQGKPFDDNSQVNPSNDYAFSKWEGEKALRALAKFGEGSLIIIRPPLIVGADAKGNLAKLLRWSAKPIPLPFAGLTNRRTLLSIENLISAIEAILAKWNHKTHSGTYVLGDSEAVSTSDILRSVVEGQNGRARLFGVPDSVLKFVLRTIGKRKLAVQLFGDLEVDTSRFQSEFNWSASVATKDSLKKMTAPISKTSLPIRE